MGTTLAHELARAIPCPAICRDEIKEGMVHATGPFEPAPGEVLMQRTLPTFLGALESGDRYFEDFDRVAIAAPSIDVDTTSGYTPTLDEVVALVMPRGGSAQLR